MNYSISRTANGNEVTTWDFPEPSCGDFAECHAEPRACDCQPDLSEPPVGIVTKVTPWTFRENVAHTVQMIRHARKENHPALEVLFTKDLHALLATR